MDANLVTIVTGGGRGIGRAIALRMAKETAIMVVGRSALDLINVRDEIVFGGQKASYTAGDVVSQITANTCKAYCKHLKVQNVICNAGIGTSGPTEPYPIKDWVKTFEVNVLGTFRFIQTFLPEMLRNGGGNICLMSSTAGLKGLKRRMAYSATKAALISMAQSLSAEHAKHGIRCVAICPNFVEGGMTERTITGLAFHRKISRDEARQIIINSTPEKRLIPEEEVAEAVAKICAGGQIPEDNILVINGEKR